MLKRSPFAEGAELIGDPTVESMLAGGQERSKSKSTMHGFVPSVQGRHVRRPTRRSSKIAAAARRFRAALQRIDGWALLDVPSNLLRALEAVPREALDDVIKYAEQPLRDFGGGEPTPGQATCARIVLEAWPGEKPGHNNPSLAKACDAYWTACNGTSGAGNWSRAIRRGKAQLTKRG
jgi:hypothetical protein